MPSKVQSHASQILTETFGSAAAQTGGYAAFQERYFHDLPGFVRDCLTWPVDEGPTDYQERILASLLDGGRVSVRGPHGLGKTALASWCILWYALTRDGRDWKVVTTASAWRQLSKFLWPEIHKWSRRIRWDLVGRPPFSDRTELLQLSLKLNTGEAFAVASDTPALIEGAHADYLLYVFDESKAIVAGTFDAAEGAFSNAGDGEHEALALAISTPGEPQGRFYDIQTRKPGYEDWRVYHVTLADTIAAGRVSTKWAEQRKAQWGEGSAVYQNRVLGEFAASDEDSIIPLAWVDAAVARWHEWQDAGGQLDGKMTALGVDVGYGGDKNVLAPRWGYCVPWLRADGKADTSEVTGKVVGILDAYGGKAIVDGIGVGAGVVDSLREKKRRVEAFIASARSELKDQTGELGFVNRRAAAWWNMRELLDPSNGAACCLPPDDVLVGDLTAPHWKVQAGGRVQVESKQEIRERLGRSTDYGDAVVMAFARPEPLKGAPGIVASTTARGWTQKGRG